MVKPAVTAALVGLCLVALGPAHAEAQPQPPSQRRVYRLNPSVDLPLMAATTPVLAVWFLADEFGPPHCAPRCDPSTLNPLDRTVAGTYVPGWQRVSDATVLSFGALAIAGLAVHEGFPSSIDDTLVVLESVMVANTMAILFNYAVRRPRPLVYGEGAPLDARMRGNASLSFFSGHTANAFAVAVGMFQVLRRSARPLVAWTALGVGLSIATFVGVSRIASGAHFPSDVFAGAIIGSAAGWAIPALHSRRVHVTPMALAAGAGVSLGGMF